MNFVLRECIKEHSSTLSWKKNKIANLFLYAGTRDFQEQFYDS